MTNGSLRLGSIVALVIMGASLVGCHEPAVGEAAAAAPAAELVANTGSEALLLLPDGKLSLWDTTGNRRWSLSTSARPGEHRLVVAPNGIVYLRTDNEILAINGEGSKQWTMPLAPAPAGSFAGLISRMDSSVLVIDSTGELICIRPDGKLDWRRVIAKGIAVAPASALNSATYVYSDGTLSSVSPGGDVAWSK
jgi:hypothetical protein